MSDSSEPPPNRPESGKTPLDAPAARPSLPSPRVSLGTTVPRGPGSLNRATLPPPGAAPDFLMPRPSVIPTSSSERAPSSSEDPWRERIASLEVQLSVVRSMVARALEELPPLRERVDAYVARLAIFDDSVRTSLTNLTERTTEIEHAAQAGRAATATMRQELAEQRRVDDARAARLSSIEERVLTIENDPRLAELRLLVDRLEMRLLAKERENESLRAYIETRMTTLEASLREQNVGNTVPPLRSISGIGPKLEAKLNAKGVADIQALAALSKDEREKLSKELGIARSKLEAWCESARRR